MCDNDTSCDVQSQSDNTADGSSVFLSLETNSAECPGCNGCKVWLARLSDARGADASVNEGKIKGPWI